MSNRRHTARSVLRRLRRLVDPDGFAAAAAAAGEPGPLLALAGRRRA
jgi:hypothetical protein